MMDTTVSHKIPEPDPAVVRRILVLLDGSRRSLAALEAAADIARAQQAEVLGIFVEEVSLLRSAGYGFAREVGRSSGVARPMDVDALEVRMQATAEKLRRTLERTLAPWGGVAQALRLCRGGEVVEQVLGGLVQPDDLLVLGGAGWSGISSFRLGSTARSLLRQAPGDVLLWPESRSLPPGRVVVLLNHDQGANHRAVRVGVELARRGQRALTVLVRSDAADDREFLEELAAMLEAGGGISARVRRLPKAGAAAMARAVREEGGAAQLVISRQCSLFEQQGAESLLCQLNLPVTITP